MDNVDEAGVPRENTCKHRDHCATVSYSATLLLLKLLKAENNTHHGNNSCCCEGQLDQSCISAAGDKGFDSLLRPEVLIRGRFRTEAGAGRQVSWLVYNLRSWRWELELDWNWHLTEWDTSCLSMSWRRSVKQVGGNRINIVCSDIVWGNELSIYVYGWSIYMVNGNMGSGWVRGGIRVGGWSSNSPPNSCSKREGQRGTDRDPNARITPNVICASNSLRPAPAWWICCSPPVQKGVYS